MTNHTDTTQQGTQANSPQTQHNGHTDSSSVATRNTGTSLGGDTRSQRWLPMGSMLNDMQRDFDRFFGPGFSSLLPFRRSSGLSGGWIPQVDVFEKDGSLIVKAELPGIDKNDIDVTLDDGNLVIKGERRHEHEVNEDQYYRMERSHGNFFRSIPMPRGVKGDDLSAKFNDGVLTVTVAKAAADQRSSTKVNVE